MFAEVGTLLGPRYRSPDDDRASNQTLAEVMAGAEVDTLMSRMAPADAQVPADADTVVWDQIACHASWMLEHTLVTPAERREHTSAVILLYTAAVSRLSVLHDVHHTWAQHEWRTRISLVVDEYLIAHGAALRTIMGRLDNQGSPKGDSSLPVRGEDGLARVAYAARQSLSAQLDMTHLVDSAMARFIARAAHMPTLAEAATGTLLDNVVQRMRAHDLQAMGLTGQRSLRQMALLRCVGEWSEWLKAGLSVEEGRKLDHDQTKARSIGTAEAVDAPPSPLLGQAAVEEAVETPSVATPPVPFNDTSPRSHENHTTWMDTSPADGQHRLVN